jgi:hypothetical protein
VTRPDMTFVYVCHGPVDTVGIGALWLVGFCPVISDFVFPFAVSRACGTTTGRRRVNRGESCHEIVSCHIKRLQLMWASLSL